MEYLHELNPQARLVGFGQELNPESYAICKGDMLVKEQDVKNIKLGNTLSDDKLYAETFDYMLSNPPFGVDWKKIEKVVKDEQKIKGYGGRFGAGTPRVSDGSLLFLLHLVSKMRDPKEGGSRIGIILNGSPLFTGGAGSGESEIRRYLLERDLVEAIIALPTDMFYNTGIATYIWVLSNHKPAERKGKVQLINASDMHESMRKSLGSKRKSISDAQIETIVRMYDRNEASKTCKIFPTTAFGYRRITVERPLQLAIYPHDADRLEALQADKAWDKWDADLQQSVLNALLTLEAKYLARDAFLKALKKAVSQAARLLSGSSDGASRSKLTAANLKLLLKHLGEHEDEAEVCTDKKGIPEPNPDLRDNENVPLSEDIQTYFEREVLPHVSNAWIDESKKDEKDGLVGIVGYEIPFNRHFYEYAPPRSLEAIDADLDAVTSEIMNLLREVHS
jgi:type I restriction enzyme M protein